MRNRWIQTEAGAQGDNKTILIGRTGGGLSSSVTQRLSSFFVGIAAKESLCRDLQEDREVALWMLKVRGSIGESKKALVCKSNKWAIEAAVGQSEVGVNISISE